MTRRAVIALGINQCVNWGVLYYAFAVLIVPVQRELGVATWVITGAFSLALLVSAVVAPAVGRWADQGRGPLIMMIGGTAAAALLLVWTVTSGVPMLYIIWVGLGMCMAATLYEPAFVIVGHAYADPVQRLRALGAITLLGGLASTIFLPSASVLIDALGWRSAVVVLALLVATVTGATYIWALRSIAATAHRFLSASVPPCVAEHDTRSLLFTSLSIAFAMASFAGAGFTANLLPALGERDVSTAAAVVLGGLMGVMQLPGRAFLMTGALARSPFGLLAVSFALHAAGFAAIALGPSLSLVAGGTMVLAVGGGLITLVRPHLIQTLFEPGGGGYLNGRIARHQQFARACGPLAVAWLAGIVGYTTVFVVIAGIFAIVVIASAGVLASPQRLASQKEAA